MTYLLELQKGVLHADSNEPHEMFQGLGQAVGEHFRIDPLNVNGHSDYAYIKLDDTQKEIERKTWGEVLQSVDKVEEQMLRHLRAFPLAEHVLLLEGMAHSVGSRRVEVLRPTRNGVWVGGQLFNQDLRGVYAWLYQMSHYITVIPTMDRWSSATAVTAMFGSDQKEDHKTLKRHIAITDFNPDPVVLIMMRMLDGVGETRALALKKKFPTIYSLVTARPQDFMEVEGIGPTLARDFCRRLGSPYA